MKKFIEVNGKMMDAVEFARFIRERTSPKIDKMIQDNIRKERENKAKLRRLQQLS